MNTLGDTDEGRARPSVWPVYLVAAVIVAVGVWLIYLWLRPSDLPPYDPRLYSRSERWAHLLVEVEFWAWVLLGFVAAVGLVGLRLWAWWCAVVFTAGWALLGGVDVLDRITSGTRHTPYPSPAEVIPFATARLVVLALLLVPLLTRRRLFFRTKQGRKE